MVWDFCKGRKRRIDDYGLEVTVFLLILHCLGLVAITVLNFVVFLALKRTSSLHASSRILLASLSLSDLCIGTIIQPICIVYYVSVLQHWPKVFCLTLLASIRLGYCFGLISMATLTLISIDRLIAIKYKTSYRNIVTKKRVLSIIIIGWVLAFSLFITGIDDYIYQTLAPILTMFFMSVLLLVTLACYGLSFLDLKKLCAQVSSNETHATDFNVSKYKHSLLTMAIISLCFLLSYLPLFLINVLQVIVTIDNLTVYLNFGEYIAMLNSLANPLIYLWRIREIRQVVKAMIFK